MGSLNEKKPRFLCLHGFRTSAEILKKQVFRRWSSSVVEKLDLVFVDAPFPCQGKSDVEGFFDPPYYEWFQFNKEFTEYQNFDNCLAYIEDCMIKYGPFDGLLGFSQGGVLSAALPGLQEKGVCLANVPKIRYVIIIGAAKLKNQAIAEKAYSLPIKCPSVHFIGKEDLLKEYGSELVESFVDPLVIHHPKGAFGSRNLGLPQVIGLPPGRRGKFTADAFIPRKDSRGYQYDRRKANRNCEEKFLVARYDAENLAIILWMVSLKNFKNFQ